MDKSRDLHGAKMIMVLSISAYPEGSIIEIIIAISFLLAFLVFIITRNVKNYNIPIWDTFIKVDLYTKIIKKEAMEHEEREEVKRVIRRIKTIKRNFSYYSPDQLKALLQHINSVEKGHTVVKVALAVLLSLLGIFISITVDWLFLFILINIMLFIGIFWYRCEIVSLNLMKEIILELIEEKKQKSS